MGAVLAPFNKAAAWSAVITALLALTLAGCGGTDESTDGAGAPAAAAPTATVAPSPEATPGPATAPPAPDPTSVAPSPTPATIPPTPAPDPTPESGSGRTAGSYDGITFVVGEGSEATFTVEEQLARLPAPIDAVMRTTALSGEVHLDGRPSTIEIDLQSLSSDQQYRDRYVRTQMFGSHSSATFTAGDVGALPEEFTRGEVATGSGTGQLEIRGITVPLALEIEARDDGDVINIIGRATFTWDEFQIPVPRARSVVSIEEEVRAEILLVVRPQGSSSP